MKEKNIVVNVASSGGRSHMLDLARELIKYGYEVNFYSYVPTSRSLKFGLPKKNNKSYAWLYAPFHLLFKITRKADWALYLFHLSFDFLVSLIMKPCDVFIGHSPMHVRSLKKAKSKYKAKVILERGTSHVLEQIKALEKNPALNGRPVMKKMFIKRDLAGYQLADFISVGSDHVKNTFLKQGFNNNKIFVNNYGVSLNEFGATCLNSEENYDLIFVGQWCYRKGCDLIENLCRDYKYSLIHVGSVVDIPFPKMSNMISFGVVDQKELIKYYSKAKVFLLPSREEGLALVQAQALICGLPILCSKFTGGRDLRHYLNDKDFILELDELNIKEMKKGVENALKLATTQINMRTYINPQKINQLTWEGYGDRYNDFLSEKVVI